MFELRLGDIIDDYCIKCRRLTNHAVVSLVEGAAAKVRCRTCYHDHDYRHELAPPSKKDLKKAELFNEVLAGVATPAPSDGANVEATPDSEAAPIPEAAPLGEAAPVVETAIAEAAPLKTEKKASRKSAKK
jgi:hypothetical protein